MFASLARFCVRRRRLVVFGIWIPLLLLFGMGLVLFGMSRQAPTSSDDSLWGVAALAFTLVLLSASFDIVFDAWRAESLTAAQRGLGALAFHGLGDQRAVQAAA